MKHHNIILTGALSMIVFSILIVGISILLDYIIPQQQVLFDLRALNLSQVVAGTTTIQALLSIYGVLPLLLIPSALGTYYAFLTKHEASMRIGLYFATAGAISLSLSLMMLPSLSWHLLSAMQTVPVEQKPVIIAILQGEHTYFGRYVGDILGLGCIAIWVLITSFTMLKSTLLPRSVAIAEVILACLMAFILIVHYMGFFSISLSIHVNSIVALWAFLGGMGLMSNFRVRKKKK